MSSRRSGDWSRRPASGGPANRTEHRRTVRSGHGTWHRHDAGASDGERNLYSIVLIDVVQSARSGVQWQQRMRNDLYALVEDVVRYRGLAWGSLPFSDIGDAIRVVVPLDRVQPTQVVDLFILGLSAGLREHRRCASEAARIRLRVAFDLGLVERHQHGWVGDALVRTARLIDAEPLREALRSDPSLDLAVVVSDPMYESVVRHGHGFISPGSFREVRVRNKEFDSRAWLLTCAATEQCRRCRGTAA